MAVDSLQKRMSSIAVGLPFRQPGVDPAELGFAVGSRQAAAGFYSGIPSEVFVTGVFADTFNTASAAVANREIIRNVTAFS